MSQSAADALQAYLDRPENQARVRRLAELDEEISLQDRENREAGEACARLKAELKSSSDTVARRKENLLNATIEEQDLERYFQEDLGLGFSGLGEGLDVSKFTEAQRTNLRKGVIGFVFQSFNLIDELNVFENIELPLLYMGIPAAERKRRVEDAMNRMAIAHRVKHFPQQLSGGQQQRVAIARAVVANPKLILADEPTGNLDSKNGKEVMELLTELNKEGTTIVMVTHSQHDSGYAGRTINLFDGQVVNEIKI